MMCHRRMLGRRITKDTPPREVAARLIKMYGEDNAAMVASNRADDTEDPERHSMYLEAMRLIETQEETQEVKR